MKKLLVVIAATALLGSCSNEKEANESPIQTETKSAFAPVDYPYKASYSSDFSIGDPNHAKMVLDLYKMWEENKIENMKSLLADSIRVDLPDGTKLPDQPVDSFLNVLKQARTGFAKVEEKFDGWMPLVANNTKETFVLTWTRSYTTDVSGKTDSSSVHTWFLVKNNKIRSWTEYQQKFTVPNPVK